MQAERFRSMLLGLADRYDTMHTLIESIDPFHADVTLALAWYTILLILPTLLCVNQCLPFGVRALWTFYFLCEIYSFVLCVFPEPRPYEVSDCLFLVPNRLKDFVVS